MMRIAGHVGKREFGHSPFLTLEEADRQRKLGLPEQMLAQLDGLVRVLPRLIV